MPRVIWERFLLGALGAAAVTALAFVLIAASATGESPPYRAPADAGPPTHATIPRHPATPAPRPQSPIPSEAPATPPPTPSPAPTVATLAAEPLIAQPAAVPAPPPASAPRPACGPYPVLLSPQPGLEAATHSALELWNAYGGCQLFQVAAGGVVIEYSREWPGPCADPGIEACTLSGIFINPSEPRYDAGSVIAHELGHVLNFGHESGLPIMDPANWSGPATVWCDLETRCR